ncbi:hypothetical protein [uncultured Tenacibaculum sp.]|uniref:hypothetical protein n=1 Tax=uncultured Tenacibaculum sp. TaxID=174713 RepID=UPI00261C99FA|nr:hypothetical protein [uncultured Tenacibaculum sp.]
MCKKDLKIHFCTCSNKQEVDIDFPDEVEQLYQHKKNEATNALLQKDGSYNEIYYKWTLSYFEEEIDKRRVMGMMVYPQRNMNDELCAENILETLNSENCFDFEYTPQEKDFIKIEKKYKFVELEGNRRPFLMDYISFKFENGQWEFGTYPMHYMHKRIEIGKVKTSKN